MNKLVCLIIAMVASATTWAQIKVGVVGPQSGQLAPYGASLNDAARESLKDLNAKSPKDRQIELLFEDDGCDPKQGVAVAQKQVDSKVQYVIGHPCTSGPAANIYSSAKVLFISVGGGTGKVLTKSNPLAFRMQAGSAFVQSVAESAKIPAFHQNGYSIGDCTPLGTKGVSINVPDKTILGKPREPDTPIVCPSSPVSAGPQPKALGQFKLSKAIGGVDPWTSQTFAATQMLATALQANPKAPVEKVAEYLLKTPIKTDLGTLQFANTRLLSKQSVVLYMPQSNQPGKLDGKLPSSVSATASDDPANDPTHPKSNCTKKSCTTEEECDVDKDGNKTNCKMKTKCEYTC